MGRVDHRIDAPLEQERTQTLGAAEPADAYLTRRECGVRHAPGERRNDLDIRTRGKLRGELTALPGAAQYQDPQRAHAHTVTLSSSKCRRIGPLSP